MRHNSRDGLSQIAFRWIKLSNTLLGYISSAYDMSQTTFRSTNRMSEPLQSLQVPSSTNTHLYSESGVLEGWIFLCALRATLEPVGWVDHLTSSLI